MISEKCIRVWWGKARFVRDIAFEIAPKIARVNGPEGGTKFDRPREYGDQLVPRQQFRVDITNPLKTGKELLQMTTLVDIR